MKVSDVLKRLHEEGWQLRRQRRDCQQFRHPEKRGWITVIGLPSEKIIYTAAIGNRGGNPFGGTAKDVIYTTRTLSELPPRVLYHPRYRRKV